MTKEIMTKNTDVRNAIASVEDRMLQMPGVMIGDCCPLKHTFVDGAYVREITMPKGMLLTSKIHKVTHPYFIMKGEVSILTEEGVVRIKAPFQGITKAGTKRLIYIHEETVWTTVHVTKETDTKKIEEEIIAKDFGELGELEDDNKTLMLAQNCLVSALMERGRNFLCLFELKQEGNLLPFKKALVKLQENGVRYDDLLAFKTGENLWHIQDYGIPLDGIELTDEDMVGTWVAIGIVTIVIGTGLQIWGSFEQAAQRRRVSEYNTLIGNQNADLAAKKRDVQKISTRVRVAQHKDRTRRVLASQRTRYGKAGVEASSGTPLIVQEKTAALGALDVLALEAAGSMEQQALIAEEARYRQDAMLSTMQGRAANIQGYYGAGRALISGATSFVRLKTATT